MPAMQLKVVLLPEPLGPISPRISPSSTSKDTFDTAVKPSNFFVRPETARSATESPTRMEEDDRGALAPRRNVVSACAGDQRVRQAAFLFPPFGLFCERVCVSV